MRMSYLKKNDFEMNEEIRRTPLRSSTLDDDYYSRRNAMRNTYSPPLTVTLARDHEFLHSKSDHDLRFADLENELRRYQELEEIHSKTIKQLRQTLDSVERESSEATRSRAKSQATIDELQFENRKLQDRILDFENRLRRQLGEKDETNHAVFRVERNYEELRHAICKILFPNGAQEGRSHEVILKKLDDYLDEQTKLKLHSLRLEEDLIKAKDEAKTERDTLRKVLDELERTKKQDVHVDLLREEKEMATRKQRQLEDELKKMEERLLRSQDRLEITQSELTEYRSKLSDVDTLTRRQTLTSQASALEFKSFKETLAALLSDIYPGIQSSEESLKEKIRQLTINRQETDAASKHLEHKLYELSKQLEEQAHLHKTAVQRARKAEDETEKLKERLKSLEGELSATDILKNGFKADKHKYIEFCQRLAQVMKVDTMSKDMGMEITGDTLLSKAERLANLEHDNNMKKRIVTGDLGRQLHETKKQLESKELHLDILRKQLAHMQSDAMHWAEKDTQDYVEKNQRLRKQIEKLEKQLAEARAAAHQVTHHADTVESLKRTCDLQRQSILDLENRLSHAEEIKLKQAKKIQHLKVEKENIQTEADHHQHQVHATEPLLEETQRLKQQLTGVMEREKQLSDTRQVIARMLGLDAQTLAVPDYEIIRRLEMILESQNLALANRAHSVDRQHVFKHHQQPALGVKSSSFGMDRKIGSGARPSTRDTHTARTSGTRMHFQ